VDLGRRLWRQEAGSKMLWKKSRERSLRKANESKVDSVQCRLMAVDFDDIYSCKWMLNVPCVSADCMCFREHYSSVIGDR